MSQKVEANTPLSYVVSITDPSGEREGRLIQTVDEAMLLVMDLLTQMDAHKLVSDYLITATSEPYEVDPLLNPDIDRMDIPPHPDDYLDSDDSDSDN